MIAHLFVYQTTIQDYSERSEFVNTPKIPLPSPLLEGEGRGFCIPKGSGRRPGEVRRADVFLPDSGSLTLPPQTNSSDNVF